MVSECISCSFSNIWPFHSPTHIPRDSSDNSHFLVTTLPSRGPDPRQDVPLPPAHPSHTLLPVPRMSPFLSSRAPLVLSSARNTLPGPRPRVDLGTPTPAGRLFPNVSSCVESSPPLLGVRTSFKAFSHPRCNTSHLCTRSNWPCAVLPSKDEGDFQGQAWCLISLQSPYWNLTLYNIFLLSYLLIAILLLKCINCYSPTKRL